MNKISKQENSLIKLFNKIAAKRFSKKEKVALIGLSIIIAFIANFMFTTWISSFKTKTSIVEPLTPPESMKLPAPLVIKDDDNEVPLVEATPKIRDPFLPSKNPQKLQPTGIKKPALNLKLSGVLWDEQIPTAIINSKVVKIGDLIEGKTVVDIEKNKVVLMEEGQILVLQLRKN